MNTPTTPIPLTEFQPFPKIARLSREVVLTEKIDGTNACVVVPLDPGEPVLAQSRTRFITPGNDNYGFAAWVREHEEELRSLGSGRHFGEWWGQGINRNYGLDHRRFSLFNTSRWDQVVWLENEGKTAEREKRAIREFVPAPTCCHVVPILWRGIFDTDEIDCVLETLHNTGSVAASDYQSPEGIVIFHPASGYLFKKTLGNDGAKGN